jgi:cobalt-zinc-cadmium resistance protein CzcA
MFERLIRFSIEQRLLVLLAVLGMALLGAFSFQRLSIDAVPDITNVQVQINTEATGYSPLEVEQRVSWPIETVMAGLPGLQQARSLSRYGLSQVTVVFEDGTDIYFARQRVLERLQDARDKLPAGITPQMGPISTGLGEIYLWTVEARDGARKPNGTEWTPMDLREIQDWIIKPQLRTVSGVTEINTIGGFSREYQVAPDPERLRAYGLTLDAVIAALERNNANVGAGYIERNGEQYLIRAPGQVGSLDELGNIVLANVDGVPVRIRDVAEVKFGRELRTGAATDNGREVVLGTVFMLIGENSRTVARAVAKRMEDINRSLPPGVRAVTVYDRTTLVDKAIATVQKNLLEGAVLVIVVLFLFLGNVRAALITAMVIPLSMLFTFTGMVQQKVSANLMSLGALDFGIIVDGAVVIVENCVRRLAHRQQLAGRALNLRERLDEVFAAARESRRPLLFGQLIIMVVYLPLFALSGVEGKMFHPMAFTVVIALLGAMILSITFIPAALALCMGGSVTERDSRLMGAVRRTYVRVLGYAFAHRRLVLGVATVVVVAAGMLATRLGSEFVPSLNEGDFAIQVLRIPGTSLSQSVAMQQQIETTLKARFPEIERVFARTGTAEVASDPMPPNISDAYVMLKPMDQWPQPRRTRAELIDAVREAVESIPGQAYEFSQPIELRFNELISGVRSDVAVKVFGDDMDELNRSAERVLAILQSVPGAVEAKVEQTTGLPVLTVRIDRARAARYGINIGDIQDTIATAMGGRTAGIVFEGDRRFDVVVRFNDALRNDLDAFARLPIALPGSSQGATRFVPLSELAVLDLQPGPNQVSRENGKRRVVVTANVSDRDLGSFVAEAQQRIAAELALSPGYWTTWGGAVREPSVGVGTTADRGAGCAGLGVPAAVHDVRHAARRSGRLHRHSVCTDRWRARAVAARHTAVDLGRRGVHRAVRSGRAERPGHDRLHPRADRRRTPVNGGNTRRCAATPASGADDRIGRFAGLRTDGSCHGHRCRGAAPAGDRCDRRHPVVDRIDSACIAAALRWPDATKGG